MEKETALKLFAETVEEIVKIKADRDKYKELYEEEEKRNERLTGQILGQYSTLNPPK